MSQVDMTNETLRRVSPQTMKMYKRSEKAAKDMGRQPAWKRAFLVARQVGHAIEAACTIANHRITADPNDAYKASLRFIGLCREYGLDPQAMIDEALSMSYAYLPPCAQDVLDDPEQVSAPYYEWLRENVLNYVCPERNAQEY